MARLLPAEQEAALDGKEAQMKRCAGCYKLLWPWSGSLVHFLTKWYHIDCYHVYVGLEGAEA